VKLSGHCVEADPQQGDKRLVDVFITVPDGLVDQFTGHGLGERGVSRVKSENTGNPAFLPILQLAGQLALLSRQLAKKPATGG
jgi:hypothetical protein